MDKFQFGDVVLLRFPFTDGQTYKRRPALIINHFNDGDILVCRITSQLYSSQFDIAVKNWEQSGLKLPSVIRVHKLATLEENMIESQMGKINDQTKSQVKQIISQLAK